MNEIEEYLKSLEFTHECDFCTFFSGNYVAPGVRPAWCDNKESEKYHKEVKEHDTCNKGDFT